MVDAEALFLTAHTAVKQKHRNWATISVAHVSSRYTEDAVAIGVGGMDKLREEGLLPPICCLVITPDVDGYEEMEAAYAGAHSASGNVFMIFDSFNDALEWTRAELKKADGMV